MARGRADPRSGIQRLVSYLVRSTRLVLVVRVDHQTVAQAVGLCHAHGEVELELAAVVELDPHPEALRLGDGPLRAVIRTVEDLGSEVFVHVAMEHHGETLSIVSRMPPPFDGSPGDNIGLELIGTTHLFGADGLRLTSTNATLV